jgi:hypothetical protein
MAPPVWQTTGMAGANCLGAGGAWRVVQQFAREPALREPGRRPTREREQEQRVPLCARPPQHAVVSNAMQRLPGR